MNGVCLGVHNKNQFPARRREKQNIFFEVFFSTATGFDNSVIGHATFISVFSSPLPLSPSALLLLFYLAFSKCVL